MGGKAGRKNVKTNERQTERSPTKALQHRRRRPGSVALREIRRYQKSTDLLIPRVPFERLAREILATVTNKVDGWRLQSMAVEALQAASEAHIVDVLQDANLCCLHAVSSLFLIFNGIVLHNSANRLSHTLHGRRCFVVEEGNSYGEGHATSPSH